MPLQIQQPWAGPDKARNFFADSARFKEGQRQFNTRNALAEKQFDTRNALDERGMAIDEAQNKRAEELQPMARAEGQFKKSQAKVALFEQILPHMTQQNYGSIEEMMKSSEDEFGVSIPITPWSEVKKMTPKQFETFKTSSGKEATEYGMKRDFQQFLADLEKGKASHKAGLEKNVATHKADQALRGGGKGRKFSDKLNQQKYEAYEAFLNDTATPKQIKAYGLDKDVYLMRAAEFVKQDINAPFDETASDKAKRTIELAEEMRSASTGAKSKTDPDGMRDLLFK